MTSILSLATTGLLKMTDVVGREGLVARRSRLRLDLRTQYGCFEGFVHVKNK